MELIHYTGDELLTGSAIAHALVRFAEALAQHQSAATIEIPIRLLDGSDSTASLLLGPASQLSITNADGPGDELIADDVVQEIERRIVALDPRPLTVEEAMLSDDGSSVASDWTDDL